MDPTDLYYQDSFDSFGTVARDYPRWEVYSLSSPSWIQVVAPLRVPKTFIRIHPYTNARTPTPRKCQVVNFSFTSFVEWLMDEIINSQNGQQKKGKIAIKWQGERQIFPLGGNQTVFKQDKL